MGHDHHHVDRRASNRHAGPLRTSLILVLAFLLLQVVVGLLTSSLALLSDAGHMATDALGLGMALAAISAANRARDVQHRTFGLYRLEILAALANAVLLFVVAGYVVFEAIRRFDDPLDVPPLPVFIVGAIGLGVNVASFVMLRRGATESLNVRGAYLEVMSDMIGSVGVIASAAITAVTDWDWVDPLVGAAIGVFILPRAYRLGRSALRVLVQAAPEGMDVDAIRAALDSIDGVVDVHDLHVWTLTSEMDVLTAHIVVGPATSAQHVLGAARTMLAERFELDHATLQVEIGDDHDCRELSW
jgi:cobalt-zinc-cadmium efflux system protein